MLSWIGKKGGYHWNSPVSIFIDRTKIKLWSSICGRSRRNFPHCHAKKNLGNYSRCCKGGGPVEKILWQTIHRWIRNTKRQGRFVSTSRNLKQRLLDRVGRLKCCRDTMRTNFYRLRGLPSWEVVAVDADYWYSMRPQFLAFNLPNIT